MPIPSREEQEKREEARVAVGSVKELAEHQKLLKVLNDEIDATKKSTKAQDEKDKKIKDLTEDIKKLEDAYKTLTEALKDNIKKMKEEDQFHNKLIAAYSQTAQKSEIYAKSAYTLLQVHHSYNLEVQKLIDLSGKFTGSTQKGIEAFRSMRKELNLTRIEAQEFGKVWSEAGRKGISSENITAMTKQLQSVFGQKGGVAAAGRIMQAQVSRQTLQALAGPEGAARGTAMAQAMRTGSLDNAYDISGLAGGAKGAQAGRAVAFERAGATAAKMKDDIQAAMAAALDLGMGPEMGALALPLAEINRNVAKLVEGSVGLQGWLKTALTVSAGGPGGISGAAGGLLGKLPGMGMLAKGLFTGAVLGAGGTAMMYGSENWAAKGSGLQKGLGVGGRAFQGAGIGAAVGSIIPGLGTGVGLAAGMATGAVYGAYEQNAKKINEMVSGVIDSGNRWMAGLLGGAEAVEQMDMGKLMTDYKTMATELPKEMENTIHQIAAMPSILADQIAQSRLPAALASIDPGPMIELANKSTTAFADSIDMIDKTLTDQMRRLNEQKTIFTERAGNKGLSAEARAGATEQLKTIEGDMIKAQMAAQQELERRNLAPKAQQYMQGFETRRGQIGQETQAVTMAYERRFAGTGNVDEMQKVIDQTNVAYNKTMESMDVSVNLAREALKTQLDRSRIEIQRVGGEQNLTEKEKYLYQTAKQGLEDLERRVPIMREEAEAARQEGIYAKKLEQAMAATLTITYASSERRMALLKAQESFVRERGAKPEEIGALAARQAAESQLQLDEFNKGLKTNIENLEKLKEGATPAKQKEIEMKIMDLRDKGLQLEQQTYQLRIEEATAAEKYRQEQIGAGKRIAEIQRDTAAKLGLSWRVQMNYQTQIIRASELDLQSKGREISNMMEVVKKTNDPKDNIKLLNLQAEYAQKQAELAESIIGKQRGFLEQATAASFGVGAGSKVSPIIGNRMFGEMVRGFTGMRQVGAPETMMTQQQRNLMGRGNVFGGIGGGVPGPGGLPGIPAGVGAGAPGAAPGAPGAAPGRAPGVAMTDITGSIKIELDTALLKVTTARFTRSENLPGGSGAVG